MNLLDFINNTFHEYRGHRGFFGQWKDIGDFLFDKGRCLELLYNYLDLGNVRQHSHEFNPVSLYRSQHIFVTFLMGLGIEYKYNLLQGINVFNEMPDEHLWMLTSVVHDYGYLKEGISNCPELEDVDSQYSLLRDDCRHKQLQVVENYSKNYPQFMTYSYDMIMRYYEYNKVRMTDERRRGWFNKDNETVDHGIYGACECYKEYCDFYIKYEYPHNCISPDNDKDDVASLGYENCRPNDDPRILKLARTEPLLYKTACLIAAQHNMFRSSNAETDREYEEYGLNQLYSSSPLAVTKDNPLLYLLSVVDTLECSKGFENMFLDEDKEHKKPFGLPIEDVLKNVNIDFDEKSFAIDYAPLVDVIDHNWSLCRKEEKRKKMHERLKGHVDSAAGLQAWVDCKSELISPYAVRITIV